VNIIFLVLVGVEDVEYGLGMTNSAGGIFRDFDWNACWLLKGVRSSSCRGGERGWGGGERAEVAGLE